MDDLTQEKGYIDAERSRLKQAEKNLQAQLSLMKETMEQ